MPGITVHFLLVYSYADQKLLECIEFADSKRATTAYAEKEQRYANRSDQFEVVLVGADSIDTIMKTHGHYFKATTDAHFESFLPALTSTAAVPV